MACICTRPEWSNKHNDIAYCDDPRFEEAQEAGLNLCAECKWYIEEE